MKYSQQHLFAIIICIIYYYSIFWNNGTWHYWTTGSSVKAISGVTLSAGKFTSLHDLSDILLFFHSNHYIWGRLFYFLVVTLIFIRGIVWNFLILLNLFNNLINSPLKIYQKIIKQFQQAQSTVTNTANENENDNKKIYRLLLPYQRYEGCNIKKPMNKGVSK